MKEDIECHPLAVGVYDLALRDYFGLKHFLEDEAGIESAGERFLASRYGKTHVPLESQKQHLRILLAFARMLLSETETFIKSRHLYSEILNLRPEAIAERLESMDAIGKRGATPMSFFAIDTLRTQFLSDNYAKTSNNEQFAKFSRERGGNSKRSKRENRGRPTFDESKARNSAEQSGPRAGL